MGLLDTLKNSGVDVGGFEKDLEKKPEDVVNEIISVLAKNPKGSFSMEMPDTAKSFLSGVLRSGNTGQKKSGMPPGATHIVPGSDGKQHYTDGQNDLGVVE